MIEIIEPAPAAPSRLELELICALLDTQSQHMEMTAELHATNMKKFGSSREKIAGLHGYAAGLRAAVTFLRDKTLPKTVHEGKAEE